MQTIIRPARQPDARPRPTGRALGFAALLVVATLLASSARPAGAGVIDPLGDFLPTYTGPRGGDLDVVFADVQLIGGRLVFTGTMAGLIGTTPGALYVWGIDRGRGTERFVSGTPSVGAGIPFDSVLVLRPDGTGAFNDLINPANSVASLAAGSVVIGGTSIIANLAASLFPSMGLPTERFTYNLWPRAGNGNALISDFAPNASNILAQVTPVPEPSSLALLSLGGFALVAAGRRRAPREAKRVRTIS